MTNYKELPLIIFGTAGASREIYYLIKDINNSFGKSIFSVIGFISENENEVGNFVTDEKIVIASDDGIKNFINENLEIGVVIPFGSPYLRKKIFKLTSQYSNVIYPNLIHPSVQLIRDTTVMGKGNIIAAGSILTCNVSLGDFNFINLHCTIGHDAIIGDFNTVNPLSAISGNVVIGDECFIGCGANILQDITLGDSCTIGAGATVIHNVNIGDTEVGVPARKINK